MNVPTGAGMDEVYSVLDENASWVYRKLQEVRDNLGNLPAVGENEIFYRGGVWQVEHEAAMGRNVLVEPGRNVIKTGIELQGERLTDWYKSQAVFYLPARVRFLAEKYGFSYSKVAVRTTRSRWGSCTADGGISINSKLILAPEEAADAIILHELSHTVHHNHSQQFWDLLRQVCPGWDDASDWLNRHYIFMEKIWVGNPLELI